VIRAKMVVTSIEDFGGNEKNPKKIKLHCQYDQSIPEDQRFSESTPTGNLEMYVNNPIVLDIMKPGKSFYLDFTEVSQDTCKKT